MGKVPINTAGMTAEDSKPIAEGPCLIQVDWGQALDLAFLLKSQVMLMWLYGPHFE